MSSTEIEDECDEMLKKLRVIAKRYECRIEICSHDLKMPVSASDYEGKNYGFGKTIAEAVRNLKTKPKIKS